ncbi:MAG: hypothetical protein ACW9W4_01095 [Candidatus Nitrosopumilus sp. bin_7KS]
MKKYFIPIIVLVGLVSSFPILFLYSSEIGITPYYEGIEIRIDKEHTKVLDQNYDEYPIYVLMKEDFVQVPQVKEMLDILLKQKFTDTREGFSHYGEYNKEYWINTDSEQISIGTGLSDMDMDRYENWKNSKSGFLFEYEGNIFGIAFWIS